MCCCSLLLHVELCLELALVLARNPTWRMDQTTTYLTLTQQLVLLPLNMCAHFMSCVSDYIPGASVIVSR